MELTTNESKEVVDDSYKIIKIPGYELQTETKNLIIAPFLNSLKYGNDLFKLIDRDAYYENYYKYVEMLLQRPLTMINMAMLSDKTILGWAMYSHKTLHYVWVKKEVRRNGIGRSLLPKEFDTISHITHKGINIWISKFPEVRFNPFA